MSEISPLLLARQVEANKKKTAHDVHAVAGPSEVKSSTEFERILKDTISRSKSNDVALSDNFEPTRKLTLGATHLSHLPSNKSGDFQQKMLGIRAYRQQILASNIANADTPGYKAVDIDIIESAGSGQSAPLPLNVSSPVHWKGNFSWKSPIVSLKYHLPSQTAADGNTVEMNTERQKFAENSLMYQFSLDRVGGEFKDMRELFQSLK